MLPVRRLSSLGTGPKQKKRQLGKAVSRAIEITRSRDGFDTTARDACAWDNLNSCTDGGHSRVNTPRGFAGLELERAVRRQINRKYGGLFPNRPAAYAGFQAASSPSPRLPDRHQHDDLANLPCQAIMGSMRSAPSPLTDTLSHGSRSTRAALIYRLAPNCGIVFLFAPFGNT